MQYTTFLDIVAGRCRTLTWLDSESKQVDVGEIELAAYAALLEISDSLDLQSFQVVNDHIATTQAGTRIYALPGDFGRLIVPRQDNESGLFIGRGTEQPTALRWRSAEEFVRLRQSEPGQPVWFTFSDNAYILLDPPPDSNGGSNYTLSGVYIKRVEALDGNANILVSHPTALIAATLARLALDKNAAQAPALVAEKTAALTRLANHHSRVMQKFQPRSRFTRI